MVLTAAGATFILQRPLPCVIVPLLGLGELYTYWILNCSCQVFHCRNQGKGRRHWPQAFTISLGSPRGGTAGGPAARITDLLDQTSPCPPEESPRTLQLASCWGKTAQIKRKHTPKRPQEARKSPRPHIGGHTSWRTFKKHKISTCSN